ncbi:MAG TPA: TIGR03013 family XrtA/PEP-CTERM system glycosyltransferase [Dokdonella sp.]|uniref:TIGR03013 family XrtA/PEP-CTERM system glycosyltransferase n=1 Tax=Dokdonella sp. TaxID=2291710 RepID=UPI002D7E4188|nr:TIGR03013 family XrtA/PEP-CTERM system glycosyltransferase [Dokdonella sp.]HET9032242.1 TIGR03013 family XrtA/PEP-CTERM system glycosyltransferase [Dokdonella sp.]
MFRTLREQGARWLLLLAVVEGLILTGSLLLSMQLRYWNDAESLAMYSPWIELRAVIFGVVMVTALAAVGLYHPSLRQNWLGFLARQAIGFAGGGISIAIVFYVFPQAYVGRSVIGIALVISFILISLTRGLFVRLLDIEGLKRRVLVFGSGRRAAKIVYSMRRRVDRRGFKVVGFLGLPGEVAAVPEENLVEYSGSLAQIAERMQVNEIVIAPEDRRGQMPMNDLLLCKQRGIRITSLITFFEREQGKVKLSLIDPSWLIFSSGFDASPLRKASKRLFDGASTLLILALTWPLILLTALAIRIESGRGAPILYRQERVGAGGRTFMLIKFRSMRTDAEGDGVARWASNNDDRVTRVGRFIRKVRLDELPQLWNVVRGDMSLIGPRPERPEFVVDLEKKIQYYNLRHCVKPGLAGWAQLNYPYGAGEKDAAEKLKYDLFYVKNHSTTLDLVILIQTVEVVLFRRGAR